MRHFSKLRTAILFVLWLSTILSSSSAELNLQPVTNPSGVQSILVVPVQFADVSASVSLEELSSGVLVQLREYYAEVSYGKVGLQIDIFNSWVTLPENVAFYGADSLRPGDDSGGNRQGSWSLVLDSIPLVDPQVDFSKYQFVVMVHAGSDQAKTSPKTLSPEIWSKTFFSQGFAGRTRDGVSVSKASMISENSPLGVWAHELAHQLGPLPDLYDTSNPDHHFVGPWSLMDSGSSLGNPAGTKPSHLDAWSRIRLGWLDSVTVIQKEAEVVLSPSELQEGTRALVIPLRDGTYYLIELRRKIGFDSSLPDEGVLVYLVDERLLNGEGPVRVVDANPSTSTLRDAAFQAGRVFRDTNNNVFLTFAVTKGREVRVSIATQLNVRLGIEAPDKLSVFQSSRANVKVIPAIPELRLEVYLDDGIRMNVTTTTDESYSVPLFFDISKIGTHTLRAVLMDRNENLILEANAQVSVEIPSYLWLVPLGLVIIAGVIITRKSRSEVRQTDVSIADFAELTGSDTREDLSARPSGKPGA